MKRETGEKAPKRKSTFPIGAVEMQPHPNWCSQDASLHYKRSGIKDHRQHVYSERMKERVMRQGTDRGRRPQVTVVVVEEKAPKRKSTATGAVDTSQLVQSRCYPHHNWCSRPPALRQLQLQRQWRMRQGRLVTALLPNCQFLGNSSLIVTAISTCISNNG